MRIDLTTSLAAGVIPVQERRVISGATMGTRYSVVWFAAPGTDDAPLAQALATAVGRVDEQMSTWKPASDLMRLNRAAVGEWVDIPAELAIVLRRALAIGRLSDGAFDIAVGDLVDAWGFGPAERADTATRSALATGTRVPAHEALLVDAELDRALKHAPIQIDLSGIAKGFGVDELAHTLDAYGIADYLVSIDGELRAKGGKPDGSDWMVALEKPERGVREAEGVIDLRDTCLATSGDYRHYADVDGRVVSHTIDPRTGTPLDNGVAAVTVRARTCLEADAWATALMVIGPENGEGLARLVGVEALFAMRD